MLADLFDSPLCRVKVTDEVTAYQYRTGVVNINGVKYVGYPIKQAILKYKQSIKQQNHDNT